MAEDMVAGNTEAGSGMKHVEGTGLNVENMNRVECIRSHALYQECVEQIAAAERDRIYCGHSEEHFLDVARIMYIRVLESQPESHISIHVNQAAQPSLTKELIYATALLHDIGRAWQYTKNIPHDEAGVDLANVILPECGFSQEETDAITFAIGDHRHKASGKAADGVDEGCGDGENIHRGQLLADLLKEADNLSRACFSCKAESTCKWSEERKNTKITI